MNKHANGIRLSMLQGLFSAGFTLMAVEILGFRLIGKTFGSSLQVTSSLITVYLTAMALGHYLGGTLSDRFGGDGTFFCTVATAGITTLFIPVIDTGLVPFIAASSTPLWVRRAKLDLSYKVTDSFLKQKGEICRIRSLCQVRVNHPPVPGPGRMADRRTLTHWEHRRN